MKNNTNITIIESDEHNYCQYEGQTSPQRAYVEIDCAARTMCSDYSGGIGPGVPMRVWNGHVQRFDIEPRLTIRAINNLMDQISSLADRVCAGYENEHGDAVFDEDAQEAMDEIEKLIAMHDGEQFNVYTVEDYLEWETPKNVLKHGTDLSSCLEAILDTGEPDDLVENQGDGERVLLDWFVDQIGIGNLDKNDVPDWLLNYDDIRDSVDDL